jgi:hypothetical protein
MSSLSYSLAINNTTTNIVIPEITVGSRIITSQGNYAGRIRKIQSVYSIDAQGVSFHYGAQVGEGGLSMGNNSQIQGNAFVDGNITGSGTITGDVVVSGNGNSITSTHVDGNVLAYSCLSPATVGGDLTYVVGGSHTCSVSGNTFSQSDEVPPQELPISQSQINEWKTQTADGIQKSAYTIGSNKTVTENSAVIITGNMTVGDNSTWNLMGSTKIIGNLTLNSNSKLNMGGTLYVTGSISFGNNTTTKLNSSYGSQSGVIVLDGTATLNSNVNIKGSGQTGSYMLVLSTNSSTSAISVGNNSIGGIFYTSTGGVQVNNNANVREVTGYKVTLGNNAILKYESGLANIFFSNGPAGGWKVMSWDEIQ